MLALRLLELLTEPVAAWACDTHPHAHPPAHPPARPPPCPPRHMPPPAHHFADAVAVEVELVLLEVLKVGLNLQEALQGLRGRDRGTWAGQQSTQEGESVGRVGMRAGERVRKTAGECG